MREKEALNMEGFCFELEIDDTELEWHGAQPHPAPQPLSGGDVGHMDVKTN